MSYLVLARKYRPQSFDDVIGQQPIATTLKNAITSERVAHAYLFAGPRGVGKTTMARILAKALNCENGPTPDPCNECDICASIAAGSDIDVREIDGASNRGIDEIRDIRSNVRLAPARARYKIYYIDEVHMLTKEAFNALLKTLEEPPSHVKFIFATTEPHRLLETVQSRCQRFDFQRISTKDIVECLSQICKAEDVQLESGVLEAIARNARGGMRDAESVLDQLMSFCTERITLADVDAVIGSAPTDSIFDLFGCVFSKDVTSALKVVDDLLRQGKDVGDLLGQFIEHVRDLMVVASCGADTSLIERSSEDVERLAKQSAGVSLDTLLYMIQILSDARRKARDNIQNRVVLEMAIVKLSRMQDLTQLKEVLAKIEELERRLLSSEAGAPSGGRASGAPRTPQEQFRRRPRNVRETVPPAAPPDQEASPSRAPAPAAEGVSGAAVSGAPSLDQLGASWPTILESVKRKNISVHAWLVEGKLAGVDEKCRATVSLPWTFHRDRLNEPETRKLVESAIEEVTGQTYALRFIKSSEQAEAAAGRPASLESPAADGGPSAIDSAEGSSIAEHAGFKSASGGGPAATPVDEAQVGRDRGAQTSRPKSFVEKLNSIEPVPPEKERVSMSELLANPTVRKAVEIFEGRIVSVEDEEDG